MSNFYRCSIKSPTVAICSSFIACIYSFLSWRIDELDEIKIRLAQNKATSERLTKLQTKLKKVQETYQWMNDLDNVAGGKMSENGKIDLETYVQVSIFD